MAMNLPKLTKQQQQSLAIGAVVIGALGFVYVKFFWIPTSARIEAAQTVIERLTKDIETAKRTAAMKPKLQEELSLLTQAALDAEKRLPKTKSVPDILVTLQTLSKRHEISLGVFSIGALGSKPYYNELSYPVQVRGTFHNIGKFLAAVALEERIYNVSNVIYGAADDKGVMTVSFTLTSYQYKG